MKQDKAIPSIGVKDELDSQRIKEGDWYVNTLTWKVERASKNVAENWDRNPSYNNGKRFLRDDYKKVKLNGQFNPAAMEELYKALEDLTYWIEHRQPNEKPGYSFEAAKSVLIKSKL